MGGGLTAQRYISSRRKEESTGAAQGGLKVKEKLPVPLPRKERKGA